jgi:hypothetical protein
LLFAPEQLHLAVDKAQGIVPLPIAERPEQLLHVERMDGLDPVRRTGFFS